jgi:general secretion pathway protein B
MSYILDALKKSEKERQRGALPDMLTVQDIVAEKPARHLHWVYLLATALLLNAGALIWWLGFSHTNKTNVVQTSKTDNISPLSVNESAQAVSGRVKPSPDSTQSVGSEFRPADRNTVPVIENNKTATSVRNQHPPKVLQKVQAYPLSANDIIKPSEPAPVKSEQSAGTGRIPSDPTGDLSEMPDENKLYKLHELPSAIRQNLPVFSVSALLYSSNPDSRMVRINEKMMHEGQDLIAGVKLEEIARDGIIVRYQKYRFYVAVK